MTELLKAVLKPNSDCLDSSSSVHFILSLLAVSYHRLSDTSAVARTRVSLYQPSLLCSVLTRFMTVVTITKKTRSVLCTIQRSICWREETSFVENVCKGIKLGVNAIYCDYSSYRVSPLIPYQTW